MGHVVARVQGLPWGIETFHYSKRSDYDLGFIDGRGYWERIFKSFGRTCDPETADKLIRLDAVK